MTCDIAPNCDFWVAEQLVRLSWIDGISVYCHQLPTSRWETSPLWLLGVHKPGFGLWVVFTDEPRAAVRELQRQLVIAFKEMEVLP